MLKTHLIFKEVNRLKRERNALHYIGIAYDEAHRCKNDPHSRYPLVEWGITEAQALQICYDRARAQFGPGPLGQFKQNWSVERLEERFAREEKEGRTGCVFSAVWWSRLRKIGQYYLFSAWKAEKGKRAVDILI